MALGPQRLELCYLHWFCSKVARPEPLQMALLSVASHATAVLRRLRRSGRRGLARCVLVDRR